MSRWLLLSHAGATLFMVGLIWFVQVVHYPLFDRVGEAGFAAYEGLHTLRTTWVVLPPMLIELVTAGLLLRARPANVPPALLLLGLGLLVLIWTSTVLLQIPCHQTLAEGFDAGVHQRLVVSNWIRTGAWSARGLLVLIMVGLELGAASRT